jgi:hypothetical protein
VLAVVRAFGGEGTPAGLAASPTHDRAVTKMERLSVVPGVGEMVPGIAGK